jgi:hypothetical protein
VIERGADETRDETRDEAKDNARAEARIEDALGALGADERPPLGWEGRVMAAAEQPVGWRRWWAGRGAILGGAMVAAAALVLLVIWRPWRAGHPAAPADLVVMIDRQGSVVRGQSTAHVGDVVHVAARRGGEHRAIWIYGEGGELLVACPGGPGCSAGEGALAAKLRLELVGLYTVVALWSAAPIAPPDGAGRDAAIAAAERAGATVIVESIPVS